MHITFTDLSGYDVVLASDTITEVFRAPAELPPNFPKIQPARTIVRSRSGRTYETDLAVVHFAAACDAVQLDKKAD